MEPDRDQDAELDRRLIAEANWIMGQHGTKAVKGDVDRMFNRLLQDAQNAGLDPTTMMVGLEADEAKAQGISEADWRRRFTSETVLLRFQLWMRHGAEARLKRLGIWPWPEAENESK